MVSGIYKITNVINAKVYIGQSKDIVRRFREHFNEKSKVSNTYLHYAMMHYGIQNFVFEVLKETYDLDYWERFFIYWYRSTDNEYGYNLTDGGQKGSRKIDTFSFTDEMKQKMSESAKRNWSDENYRKQIIDFQNKGKQTDEARKNRSVATKKMWQNGKFAEQAKKISKKMKGVEKSEETKLKMKKASKIRELNHHRDYEIYLSNGGDLNYNEFCKHYKNGINDLLEV
jgi:group I intron endonuclease